MLVSDRPEDRGRVYFLGAGTSVCAGGPTLANFRDKARSTARHVDPSSASGRAFIEAIDYWDQTCPDWSIEDFYILADLHERTERNTTLANGVRYLIAKTIKDSMGTGPSQVHADFIEAIGAHWRLNQAAPTIITLNWDIALDNAIAARQANLDYGYDQLQRRGPRPSHPRTRAMRSFKLLKLHGSLNWQYCPACLRLNYHVGEKSALEWWESETPTQCDNPACATHEALQPFFIPPLSQKFSDAKWAPILADMWTEARNALKSCSEVIFVGYSFPATDVQTRVFVASALSKNPVPPKISVLTRPCFGSARQEFEDRYSFAFSRPSLSNSLHFGYTTFEEWVAGQCSGRGR